MKLVNRSPIFNLFCSEPDFTIQKGEYLLEMLELVTDSFDGLRKLV